MGWRNDAHSPLGREQCRDASRTSGLASHSHHGRSSRRRELGHCLLQMSRAKGSSETTSARLARRSAIRAGKANTSLRDGDSRVLRPTHPEGNLVVRSDSFSHSPLRARGKKRAIFTTQLATHQALARQPTVKCATIHVSKDMKKPRKGLGGWRALLNSCRP